MDDVFDPVKMQAFNQMMESIPVEKPRNMSIPASPSHNYSGGKSNNSFSDLSSYQTPASSSTSYRMTQKFGNYNPGVEKHSGGINLGADFATPTGTPLRVPEGRWQVVEAYGGAREGDGEANYGSGNTVALRNMMTGETLKFEHLSSIGVQPGQEIDGGAVVALSGNTGNSTGPHSSIVYVDPQGRYQDIMGTNYLQGIFSR